MANFLQKLHLTPGTGVGAKAYDIMAPKGSPQRRFLTGHGEETTQLPLKTPAQRALIEQNAQQGAQNTNFDAIENLAQKRFNEQGVQSIMARYLNHGQNQNSSAMQGALGGARADLDAQLAALRSQYGLHQSQLGLTPQFENIYKPESYGLLGQILPTAARAALGYATGGLSEGAYAMGQGDQSPLSRLFGGNQQQLQSTVPNSGIGQNYPQWQALEEMKQQGNPENSRYVDFFNQNQNNQTPWKPGARQMGRPGAFGADPLLMQLLSRYQGQPGVGNYIPENNRR